MSTNFKYSARRRGNVETGVWRLESGDWEDEMEWMDEWKERG